MRVSLQFSFDTEQDGFDGTLTYTREEVDDLYALAQMFTDAVRGAGFSYVVNTGFEKDDGNVVFGEF
jgi:hypothetical protein